MQAFSSNPGAKVDWSQKEREIKCLEEYVTFEECRRFYEVLFAPANANSAEKQEEATTLDELTSYKNPNQIDQRNYLCLRVFASKWRDEMKYTLLE